LNKINILSTARKRLTALIKNEKQHFLIITHLKRAYKKNPTEQKNTFNLTNSFTLNVEGQNKNIQFIGK